MSKSILKIGSSGAEVTELQTVLTARGYPCGIIDGDFGPKTLAAVKEFQTDNGLTVDGVVGPATWAALEEDNSVAPEPVDLVLDFIRWGLTHAKPGSIPAGAKLLLPAEECGTDPWEYLYGTSGKKVTQKLLDDKYQDPYKDWGWSRALYDRATAGWVAGGITVCDCQGLLDAYCTLVLGVKTDLSANGCFTKWCTDTGRLRDISRAYVIGEALFRANEYGTMKHIGWVCGFAADGEPLVLEARGLSYGCVVTRLSGRGWTHRGLMTRRFVYGTPVQQEAFHAICSGGSVNIRAGRGTEHDVVAVAHRDDLVLALTPVDGWCRVAVAMNGDIVSGYMSAKYVAEV